MYMFVNMKLRLFETLVWFTSALSSMSTNTHIALATIIGAIRF